MAKIMKSRDRSDVLAAFTYVFQFGINMLVPIFLCTFAGVFIGRITGADWVVVPLFFVGALAGARNTYIQAKKLYDRGDHKKDKKT